MGYLGDCYTVRSQQTSIQLLQHLEVFKRCEDIGVMILHRQECTVGTHRRRLQQSITGDSCSVDQRAWLSNALVGQCNVTNPTQLLALTDVQTQNCCTYAMSLVDQHCFEPCKGEEGQQSISTEQFGLASFWVAYCEVEYNCNSNTEVMKKLPGNYSLASVPNIGGVEEEVLEGEDEDEDEEGMATAVLTAAAQSQLYALASVRASQQESYDQTESQDDNRYEALSQSSTIENIQEEVETNEQLPRLSMETLKQLIPNGLPPQVANRSIVQNLNLMPDLSLANQSINYLASIKQHLAQVDGKTYTFFAPTNQAFQDLAETLGVQVQTLSSLTSWQSIIKNLIVPGEHSLLQLQPGDKLQTLVADAYIVWEHSILQQSVIMKGCCDPANFATLLLGDIRMGNGMLHVIDKIILPPDAPFTPGDVTFTGG